MYAGLGAADRRPGDLSGASTSWRRRRPRVGGSPPPTTACPERQQHLALTLTASWTLLTATFTPRPGEHQQEFKLPYVGEGLTRPASSPGPAWARHSHRGRPGHRGGRSRRRRRSSAAQPVRGNRRRAAGGGRGTADARAPDHRGSRGRHDGRPASWWLSPPRAGARDRGGRRRAGRCAGRAQPGAHLSPAPLSGSAAGMLGADAPPGPHRRSSSATGGSARLDDPTGGRRSGDATVI